LDYRLNYADIQSEAPIDAKSRERELLRRSIDMMEAAQGLDPSAKASIEAMHFTSRVWTAFLNDLAASDNELPDKMRACLISIGIWILKTLDAVRVAKRADYSGIIEITEIIREGLL
jgi:flagellar biosynthesis activator protein FlaF